MSKTLQLMARIKMERGIQNIPEMSTFRYYMRICILSYKNSQTLEFYVQDCHIITRDAFREIAVELGDSLRIHNAAPQAYRGTEQLREKLIYLRGPK